MTAAFSATTAVLVGISILAAGLFLLSVYVLVLEWSRNRSLARAGRETYEFVSKTVREAGLADEESLERITKRSATWIRRLEGVGHREAAGDYIDQGRELLAEMQSQKKRLEPAYVRALGLSIEELGFLRSQEESEIASLVAFFRATDRFEEQLDAARRE